MNILANCIHKRFQRGCLEFLESAIKLNLPIKDMLYLVFCYYQSFKSPFLSSEEFEKYSRGLTFGEIMEELLVARDIMTAKMNKDLMDFEGHLSVWKKDAAEKYEESV